MNRNTTIKNTNNIDTNKIQQLMGIHFEEEKRLPSEFVLFDLEAVGSSEEDEDWMEIIEVGAYKVRVTEEKIPVLALATFGEESFEIEYPAEYSIEVIDSYHSYIKPVFHSTIPKRLSKLLHISHDEYNQLKHSAPEFTQVIHEFVDWAGKDSIFVSWSSSDEDMIAVNCDMNYLYDLPKLSFLDLQFEYDTFKNSSRRTGLSLAMEEQGIEFEGVQHTALDDTYNMFGIFKKMIEKHGLKFTTNTTQNTELVAGRA